MRRVIIVQSFDGHPPGAVVELPDSAAESAVIQRRAVLVPRQGMTLRLELVEEHEGKPPGSHIDVDLGVASVLLLRKVGKPVTQLEEPARATSYGSLLKAELVALTEEREITASPKATKADLVALLEVSDAEGND